MNRKFAVGLAVASSVLISVAAVALVAARIPYSYDLASNRGGEPPRRPAWIEDWKDRLGEMVLPWIDPGDTIYPPGFSEKEFLSISLGASEPEVLQKLGEPFERRTLQDARNITIWYYSWYGPRSRSYFVRALAFDEQGRVARKRRYYYLH